jgi:Zn-dependent peptidase ImmA (M78 family)
VRFVPDITGRFGKRPHFEPIELDRACERVVLHFLNGKYGAARFPVTTDDFQVLVESYVGDLDVYADLTELGKDVEGVTHFYSGNRPAIRVSKKLAEDAKYENRFRTTLAHELGHVLFHSDLNGKDVRTKDMFAQEEADTTITCKRDSVLSAAASDWMEWQAGYASGALLMPFTVVADLRLAMLPPTLGPVSRSAPEAEVLISALMRKCQVSRFAAEVRLAKLGVIAQSSSQNDLLADT